VRNFGNPALVREGTHATWSWVSKLLVEFCSSPWL
jgi:hypothetical protein